MPKLDIGPAVKKNTIHEKTLNRLKEVILSGQLSTDSFYTEKDFAESLQISRTPVREAVKSLIHDGLLVSYPRKGIKVRQFTDSEIEQIFLLRKTVESSVFKKATKAVTKDQLETLSRTITQQKDAIEKNDRIAFIELDQQFHIDLVRLTDYHLIEEVITYLHNMSRLIGHQAIKKQGRMGEVIKEHQDIIQALDKREVPQAEHKMMVHLDRTQDSFQMMGSHGSD